MDYQSCPYDHLFQHYAKAFKLPWKLIKAQAWAESRFNPNALSPSGARGLLQLMPKTDMAIDGHIDAFDVEGNVKDGVQYDREQYDHLKEIPDICERLKFSLASYNGGRGWINLAMEIAYAYEKEEPMPHGHIGAKPGLWQTWEFTKRFLSRPDCQDAHGKHPDHKQMIDYVEKIWSVFIPDIFEMEVKV